MTKERCPRCGAEKHMGRCKGAGKLQTAAKAKEKPERIKPPAYKEYTGDAALDDEMNRMRRIVTDYEELTEAGKAYVNGRLGL